MGFVYSSDFCFTFKRRIPYENIRRFTFCRASRFPAVSVGFIHVLDDPEKMTRDYILRLQTSLYSSRRSRRRPHHHSSLPTPHPRFGWRNPSPNSLNWKKWVPNALDRRCFSGRQAVQSSRSIIIKSGLCLTKNGHFLCVTSWNKHCPTTEGGHFLTTQGMGIVSPYRVGIVSSHVEHCLIT